MISFKFLIVKTVIQKMMKASNNKIYKKFNK